MSEKREVYISIDIEADGPSPGLYSMLSFGAVAFEMRDKQFVELGRFQSNLECLKDAKEHPDTMAFWARFPEMYKKTRENMAHPAVGMAMFDKWLELMQSNGHLIPVGYPAAYDYKWIDWYLWYFVGKNRMGFACLDMKSFANAQLKHKHFASTSKKNMPKNWFDKNIPHTHEAIQDAIEQAHLFSKMWLENKYGQ
jgi:hypothetical protein